ncbi:MAG: Crp/Fnr family transcriptional regulator [Acidobacteria bacterium]|nr:Crp/Fnr family transcriptional regulator [Acidobacteriota bacterium]
MEPVDTLRRVPFFAVLPADELKALAGHCIVRRIARDEILFAEGESCEGLYVVQSGAVKLFKMADTGREQVLVIERAGSTVAELPLFDGGNFPASAAAVENSTLLFLPKREFLDLCRHNSEVAFAVIRTLAWRFRYMTSLVEELSLKEVSHPRPGVSARGNQPGDRRRYRHGPRPCLAQPAAFCGPWDSSTRAPQSDCAGFGRA